MKTLFLFLMVWLPSGEPANVPVLMQFEVPAHVCEEAEMSYVGLGGNLPEGTMMVRVVWCQ